MHELSLVETLIEQVADELRSVGRHGRVLRLELAVGRLSGVHVASLQFAFEVLAPGSVVEGAKLCIRQPPARGNCRDCGHQFDAAEYLPACPSCHSGNVRIEGGQELMLDAIELEDVDA